MRYIFLHIKLIWQGWRNYILDLISDLKYKEYFDERFRICEECEHNIHNICEECGCILQAKTKAEDAECPVGKWKTISETLEEEYEEKS